MYEIKQLSQLKMLLIDSLGIVYAPTSSIFLRCKKCGSFSYFDKKTQLKFGRMTVIDNFNCKLLFDN